MRSILYYILLLALTLASLVIFCAIFALVYPFDRQRRTMHALSALWSRTIFRMNPWWRTEVTGREHIERGKAYVVVVNHSSMLDIPLMYVLPLRFRWVSKREVYRWPIFGIVMRMHGDIAIERGAAKGARTMLREGARNLGRGTSVIVFPEGTRSRTGEPGRFREGAFVLAKAAGVEVLPCVASGTGDYMDGWRLRMPHRFGVKILPPIATDQLSAAELAEKARTMISAK